MRRIRTTALLTAATAAALIGLAAPAMASGNPTSAPGSVGVGATVQSALTLTITGSISFGSILPGKTQLAGSTPIGFYWTDLPSGSPWASGFAGNTGPEQVDVSVQSNDGSGYFVTETLNGPMTAPGTSVTIPDTDIFAWLDNASANSNPYVFSGLISAPAGVGTGTADQGVFAKSATVSSGSGDTYPLALGLDTPAVLPAGSYSTSLTMLALGN